MFKKLTYCLMLVASLMMLPMSMQTVAADKPMTKADTTQGIEKVSINKANAKQLATINGIGMKKAQAIVDYRKTNGKFATLEALINVKGIGAGTFRKIKPFLTL